MKYRIITLGCKVNQYETQAIETLLMQRGHSPCPPGEADAVIINTCAVTAESGRKSRQAVRRMRNEDPTAIVVVCGCFSQISPGETEALGADIVYGSGDRIGLVADIESVFEEKEQIRKIDDPFKRTVFEELPAGAVSARTRAMLKIQDGCDNFCSYCVIPYARGRVRSMPLVAVRKSARDLAAAGYMEIVITGIEIASYGKDFRDGTTLADAVLAIADEAPGLRLRLGSLEPTAVTEEFCGVLAKAKKLCRHFHISLQSGCDETLKRMNRKYDTAKVTEVLSRLRRCFPGCGVTTDLIVGFPGETPEEFQATLDFISSCGFSKMHIFPYSPREGTKAAAMESQLGKAEKTQRAKKVQALADEMERAFLNSCVGGVLPVLFEAEDAGRSHGHADNYCPVEVEEAGLRGLVKNVQILGVSGESLVGKTV